jgi:hypothetical protein
MEEYHCYLYTKSLFKALNQCQFHTYMKLLGIISVDLDVKKWTTLYINQLLDRKKADTMEQYSRYLLTSRKPVTQERSISQHSHWI